MNSGHGGEAKDMTISRGYSLHQIIHGTLNGLRGKDKASPYLILDSFDRRKLDPVCVSERKPDFFPSAIAVWEQCLMV